MPLRGIEAAIEFLAFKAENKLCSPEYLQEVALHLDRWGRYPGFETPDSFTVNDIHRFLVHLAEGWITPRMLNDHDAYGNVRYEKSWDGKYIRNSSGRRVPKKVRIRGFTSERRTLRNRYLASLKSFMEWARTQEPPLTTNTADRRVRRICENRGSRPPSPISRESWEAAAVHLAERWRLAQDVMLGTGMTYRELARLQAADIGDWFISIMKSGRGARRKIPASERVIAAAKRLLEIGGVPDDDAEQMGHRLKAACKAAKIQPYTTRQLRDTYGVTCLRNGMDPATLLVRMRHRRQEATEKLIRALEVERGDDFAPV